MNWVELENQLKDVLEVLKSNEEGLDFLETARTFKESNLNGTPKDWQAILCDLQQRIMPFCGKWQNAGFFSYFPATTSIPSCLAEVILACINPNAMLMSTCPIATTLEQLVTDWTAKELNLGSQFYHHQMGGGTLLHGSSEGIIMAILAAKKKFQTQHNLTNKQLYNEAAKFHLYITEETHLCILRAWITCGLRTDNIHYIELNSDASMNITELQRQIKETHNNGDIPFMIVSTAGSTSLMAIDNIAAISAITRESSIWHHIDAACLGAFASCPEYQYLLKGSENAHSISINFHKLMFVSMECSGFWVFNKEYLVDCLPADANYFSGSKSSNKSEDLKNWQLFIGKRFTALKVWLTYQYLGTEFFRAHIRESIQKAQEFKNCLLDYPYIEVSPHSKFNLILFKPKAVDAQDVSSKLASQGVFISTTTVNKVCYLRMAFGGIHTNTVDCSNILSLICQFASPSK